MHLGIRSILPVREGEPMKFRIQVVRMAADSESCYG
jgi:hypothetical protein